MTGPGSQGQAVLDQPHKGEAAAAQALGRARPQEEA